MKKYICFVVAILAFVGCAKEEPLEISVDDTRYYFEPKPEMTDETSQLRRAFYEKYDIHLLFSDTLRHDSLGVDFNGDAYYFTEKIDINYSVGSYSSSTTQDFYKLLTTMTQRYKATKYLETEIQPHFNERMRPFSWLLVSEIAERASKYDNFTYPYALTGERCIAIALQTYFKLPPARVPAFTQQILNTIAVKMAKNNSKALTEFYAYSKSYYGKYFADSYISNEENTKYLREAGFISKGKNTAGYTSNGYYPDNETDVADFVRVSIANTRDKVKQTYAAYPLIIQKDSVIRILLEERGFVYDPETPTDIVTNKFYNE